MRTDEGEAAPAWEGVAVLCKDEQGRSLLMVLQGQPDETPTWAVPGGSMEPGETPEGAAVREAREETGLKVRIRRRYTVVSGVKAYGAFQVHFFEAEVTGGKMRTDDPDGLIHQVTWVPAQRLPDLKLSHEDQREILTEFMGEKADQ